MAEEKEIKIPYPIVDLGLDYAFEHCEDWKPEKYWECKEIDFLWFSKKQLQELIKHCVRIGIKEATTANENR